MRFLSYDSIAERWQGSVPISLIDTSSVACAPAWDL